MVGQQRNITKIHPQILYTLIALHQAHHFPIFFRQQRQTMRLPVDRTSDFALLLRSRSENDEELFFSPTETATDTFTEDTTALRKRIRDMREVITRNRRRYTDFSGRGMNDSERDNIDSSTGDFVRGAMSQLDNFRRDHQTAHELGVALVLSGELQTLGAAAEELRTARIRHAMETNRKATRMSVTLDETAVAEMMRETKKEETTDEQFVSMAASEMEQEFAQENARLVADLVETRERVQQAEREVAEIAGLNHVFATKVLEQAREIEGLYTTAVDAANYLDYGNKQLMAMRGQRNTLTYALVAFLVFASLLLLVLEMASSSRPF